MAWGDWDGDGDLDLAVGNDGNNRVYANSGGDLALAWTSLEVEFTYSVAWGDWDGDGDLDLAVGNDGNNRVYANGGRDLALAWTSPESDGTGRVAWGDWDGDGDLDLAVGNRVYTNVGGDLVLAWTSADGGASSVAWGDWDGDGDLDLAVGSRVYANVGGDLALAWTSPESDDTRSVAWGDWDGDGDLDLAVGNYAGNNRVYANSGGDLALAWTSPESDDTRGVAWGDWDGDGDLDLAVGNSDVLSGQQNRVYVNSGGDLALAWSSPESDGTRSVAWGDWDGDGDLDLAVGNGYDRNPGQQNRVYVNSGGDLVLAWSSPESDRTSSVAWGDWDGDGDLDLAVGNYGYPGQQNRVYVNSGGNLALAWTSPESDGTRSVAWGDWDGDGDLDLAAGNRVYVSGGYDLAVLSRPTTGGLLAYPGPAINYLYGAGTILEGPVLPISYSLTNAFGFEISEIRAYYSFVGGGPFTAEEPVWRPAIPASGTLTTGLATSPTGTEYVFYWDLAASQLFGASDNVVFRMDVYQGTDGHGPFQYEVRRSQTAPFRIRGSQARVVSGTEPITYSQAIVLRQASGTNSQFVPYMDNLNRPYVTNPGGYLQGYGELAIGDRLVALAPITATDSYTLYYSSAAPTSTGVEPYTVSAYGVQTLTVSAENPLLLFNLDVSLEWDARDDNAFLEQLDNDLQRTSQILYDLTDGQVALGRINIYFDRENWENADIIIQAANDQRPAAVLGGIVITPTNDFIDAPTGTITIENAFLPGQVRMGATWSRFGDPGGTLGEDWPRALAHELGHYLLFLPDNYLGLSPDNYLALVDCEGSVMSDPYAVSYSEFLTRTRWTGECLDTLAERFLNRADWETILTQYPMLNGERENTGPSNLPLAVTRIYTVPLDSDPATIPDPIFNLEDRDGNPLPIPIGQGQGYLFKTNDPGDPNDDYVIRLGSPIGDLILARGAEPDDKLCVYDYSQSPIRLGCLTVSNNGEAITLHELNDWAPQIEVQQVTTNTFAITVTQNITGLNVQLLPNLGPSSDSTPMVDNGNGIFTQTIVLPDRAYAGYVRVSVPRISPTYEFMGEFAFVGEWSGKAFAWGGKAFAWGGRAFAWGAPVLSTDGQVALYNLEDPFGGVVSYTLEALPLPPELPSWLTVVGTAYRVDVEGEQVNSAILFRYLGRDVPGGNESLLQAYFLPEGDTEWIPIATELDADHNHASATLQGSGIYALIATIQYPPFNEGWNNFSYPVQVSRPITEALASIDSSYNAVLNYDPVLGWRRFDTAVQPPFEGLVNTLQQLEYLRAYWLYATEPVTLYLGVDPGHIQTLAPPETESNLFPPATFYGWITPTEQLSVTAGSEVQAWINGNLCGEAVVVDYQGSLAYAVHVEAADPFTPDGCGDNGAEITFTVDGQELPELVSWDNSQSWYWSIIIEEPGTTVFLPIVRRSGSGNSSAVPTSVRHGAPGERAKRSWPALITAMLAIMPLLAVRSDWLAGRKTRYIGHRTGSSE